MPASELGLLRCEACGHAAPPGAINSPAGERCPNCHQPLWFFVFSRAFAPAPKSTTGERLFDAQESSCYYHPEKRAASACDHCGRFLCALCDVEMDGAHLCPRCIEQGVDVSGLATPREFVHYDTIALHLGVWPLIVVFPVMLVIPVLVTAPVVLYLVVRHWRTRLSAVPRNRWRFVVAGAFGLLQIAAVTAIVLSYAGFY